MIAAITIPFIGDYYGRKRPYIVGLIIRAIGVLLAMKGPGLPFMYLGHFLMGYAPLLCGLSVFYYVIELIP